MTEPTGKVALVTGASSGIGREVARVHASRGGRLILVARRVSRLEQLAAELRATCRAEVVIEPADLSDVDAADRLVRRLEAGGIAVDYLINNAGFGGLGRVHERPWALDRAMLTVNVMSVTALTRSLLPAMLARGSGRILNVASVAGFWPGPLQAVYYATKAYVISFTEALAGELAGTGVSATALCPGVTDTEFARVAGVEEVRQFRRAGADPRAVATFGYDAMLQGRVLAVPGVMNKLVAHGLPRLLPRQVATRLSRSRMEKAEE